jgi:cell division initiation protein
MEKEKMKITPQDIIDKEFRVKFRGFDMAEVDTFLEEVAENFFKLTEENTLLHEKIASLWRDLGAARTASAGPVELPPELGAMLEELKQDTSAMGAELSALKQDRQSLDALKKNLEKMLVSMQESDATAASGQAGVSSDLAAILDDIQKGSAALNAELAALKEDRRSFDTLQKNLEDALAATHQAQTVLASQGQGEAPPELGKTLEDFKKDSETVTAELAALKQEVAALAGVREEIKTELQDMLSSHFARMEEKLSAMADATPRPKPEPTAAPEKKDTLARATIIEGHEENIEEDTRVPADEEQEEDADDDYGLEFLNEDHILDVDKLRDMFQTVLDDTVSDSHDSRSADDTSSDLLFFGDDFIDDQNEPQVTFSEGESKNETSLKNKKE